MPKTYTTSIVNRTRSTTVCQNVRLATTFLSGLRGLLGTDALEAGTGLLLRPSSGVHTWGMRFSIDIIALDRKMKVIGLWQETKPRRVCAISLRTWCVLELPAGQIKASRTSKGDQCEELSH